ncbi:MAG TPA: CpsD/CapB family tyrosine-protein kinase [Vicinamibacterales bacterium]|nr:CpsD/CapB family tyrosine-protein kinase [Vicinamibacterales bacterium]
MSRIEEALRRSHAREIAPAGESRGPAADSFKSPWDFSGTEIARIPERAPERTPERVPEAAPAALSQLPDNALENSGGVISGFNSQWKQRLVVSDDRDPYLVEQFRRLAATLHQAQAANQIKTVMVTSASPNDGKTLTAINLALILSESYRRQVLLIDADLRRPSIRDVTQMPDVVGLADGLRARAEQRLTVFRLTKNLSLLPAGRPDPDPMGSLTSSRMRRIIADACTRFDWVVLDAPPVGTVSDASILAEMVDASLLVVRAGQTDCGLTQKAIEAVGRDRILGVVLNGADVTITDRRYYQAYAPGSSAE